MEEKYFKRKVSKDCIDENTNFSLLPFDRQESKQELEVVPNLTLSATKEEIVGRMKETNNIDELKDLTNLFGISLTKAEIIRASKESDLMDKLLEQSEKRISENADYLPHDVLLDYLKTFQASVDKSRKNFNDDVDKASINITKNEINVNVNESTSSLSRESREKVLNVMQALFTKIREEQVDVKEVKEPEEFDLSKEENEEDDD